ncbi:MAG: cell wall-binding repeat-containing protein [bacterium]|nr:cell wall-binding repeat-containing protein [bacterium]
MKKFSLFGFLVLALVFGVFGVPPTQTQAHSSSQDRAVWIPNSTVNAVVTNGTSTYVGGNFTQVGPYTGHLVKVDGTTGTQQSGLPVVNGRVAAIEPDGSGGWYIGGLFSEVGGVARTNLAHILSNGSVDAGWDATTNDTVQDLARIGTTLYVGGDFTSLDGATRNRIGALDSSGNLTSWDPDADDTVYALDTTATTVYAAGGFTTIGGASRTGIAEVSAATGTASAWDPCGACGAASFDVQGEGSTVYIGGGFSSMGGSVRNSVAEVDATTGLATAWDPDVTGGLSGEVYTVFVDGSTIYLGGDFTDVGGSTRNNAAAVNDTTGAATSWDPDFDDIVQRLTVSGSTVYVIGLFDYSGSTRRHRAAAFTTAGALTGWNPTPSGSMDDIEVIGSEVYLSGTFRSVNGVVREGLVELDANGEATSWDPGLNFGSNVLALAIPTASLSASPTLYVGGAGITTADGGTARTNAAAFNTSTDTLTGWAPDPNSAVYSLFADGTTVYAGGDFTSIGGSARNRIAALNPTSGVATAWDPDANARVRTLERVGSTVYAGGDFTSIGGSARSRIAALDATSGSASAWDPSASGTVNSLDVDGSSVYAGGAFTTIGGASRSRIAEIDTTSGSATGWDPGASGTVNAVLVRPDTVIVGGVFASLGGSTRNRLGEVTRTGAKATSWDPNINPSVPPIVGINALAGTTERVWSGGLFVDVGAIGREWSNLAAFDLTTVQFATATSQVEETAGDATIDLVLNQTDGEDVTVDYSVTGGTASAGTDYLLPDGSLTITAGQASGTIPITIIDDRQAETDETVIVTLSNPSDNADLGLVTEHTLTIIDNEPGAGTVSRIDESDPIELAIRFSEINYPQPGSAEAIVLARSNLIADSLTVSPWASLIDATLLLNPTDALDSSVLDEINRVLPDTDREIWLAGGDQALSQQVVADLASAGYTNTHRFAGTERRDTARLIAEQINDRNPSPTTKINLAEDRAFADALSIGAAAANRVNDAAVTPILLTERRQTKLSADASTYLSAHPEVSEVEVIGGDTAVPYDVDAQIQAEHPSVLTVLRQEGATRFDTNHAIVSSYFAEPHTIVVANGQPKGLPGASSVKPIISTASETAAFFSALLAGKFAADHDAALLLTTTEDLPDVLAKYISERADSIEIAYIIGDTSLVSVAVENYVGSLIQ